MRVVLAGASGSGKTTLAKALAEHFGWVFKENSAGMIITDLNKEIMRDRFGYKGDWGQRRVINHSHTIPEFGRSFQNSVLISRHELQNLEKKDAVYDRSCLDPIVFYLNQVVHNDTQEDTEHFFKKCVVGMRDVDLILRIPLQNPNREIENNESRVNNWYFQNKIDGLFDQAINIMVQLNEESGRTLIPAPHKIIITRSPGWDWEQRFAWATNSINRLVNGHF